MGPITQSAELQVSDPLDKTGVLQTFPVLQKNPGRDFSA